MTTNTIIFELDKFTKQWLEEAMASFWQDGSGKVDKDPWDEFEEEVWRQLREDNPRQ